MELRKVIVRFLDGRVIPGFAPLFEEGTDPVPAVDLAGMPLLLPLADLKAVFYVRTFSGNPEYDAPKSVEGLLVGPQAAVLRLPFTDGETVLAEALAPPPPGRGFFVTVLDPEDNNLLLYVNPGALAGEPEVALPPEEGGD